MDMMMILGLLASGVRFATPLMFAAMGEAISQRAGVLNVGLEGIMLVGAFLAVLFAVLTGSPWGGFAAALAGGAILGLLHGYFAIRLKVDQIVSGIALILLGMGLSGVGYRMIFGQGGTGQVPGFARVNLGVLSELPILGPLFFSHHALVYLALGLAVALTWMLHRTGWGLMIRAAGESPGAADKAGVPVDRLRMICVAFGGAMAGAGGAYLSTAQLAGFVENMVAGRGFIAIACVVFARWNPLGVVAVALLFGIADAGQIRLQALYPDVPYQAFIALPYLLALAALVVTARSAHLPAALAQPYRR
ncbi:MAG: ABC transporter permease [Alphaproteobacteria bacterium HGW-Alphaproteobacteria-2]|nr:MAG: ABC transporter permease [Alphaproteobacteria bacterium HGW-Alphaproteobacteria-2]